jgi:hypothetical protein
VDEHDGLARTGLEHPHAERGVGEVEPPFGGGDAELVQEVALGDGEVVRCGHGCSILRGGARVIGRDRE